MLGSETRHHEAKLVDLEYESENTHREQAAKASRSPKKVK